MMAEDLALSKISEANILLDKISDLDKNGVKGASKLRKRIKAEINFLNKGLKKGSELKEDHVLCSNLGQLGALYDVASQASQVVGVLQNFSNGQLEEKVVVDVVAESGKQWIKVILRCPKALHLLYVMGGRKGVKPLDEVAEDFLVMADHHPVFYSVPQVVFWFFSGVSESLASDLEELGVMVKGTRIPDDELGVPDFTIDDTDTDCESYAESEESASAPEKIREAKENEMGCRQKLDIETNVSHEEVNERTVNCHSELRLCLNQAESSNQNLNLLKTNNNDSPVEVISSQSHKAESLQVLDSSINNEEKIKIINLDVTALIAYVSATTNGGANYVFADKVLTEQAMWERENPVKETLDHYFEGCELLVCQEAVSHFSEIISTIGGPEEKKRAQDLMARLMVVPGQDIFKDKIKIGGKVRELSRLIFGTSQAHRAITVTSNRGFVRSAEQQGIKPVVLYHEPRALTEMKEGAATPLENV